MNVYLKKNGELWNIGKGREGREKKWKENQKIKNGSLFSLFFRKALPFLNRKRHFRLTSMSIASIGKPEVAS
jgi:hypothetical protein